MNQILRNLMIATSLTAIFAVAGCANSGSSKTEALEESKPAAKTTDQTNSEDKAEDETKATEEKAAEGKVFRKTGKVQNRGGFIRLSVNQNPITNFDLSRREKFLRLRRQPGNLKEAAENEMIEQILKLQEATRRRTLASDEAVDSAFATFASRNRTTPANLSRELGRLGIGAEHFKNFIRTQISWQRTVQGRFQSETTQVTEQQAIIGLRSSGAEKPELTEYNFKQIVFVIPENRRNKTTLATRKKEAAIFRQNYTSCANAINLAKTLRDVSVIDRKRILEPELPANWKTQIIEVGESGITSVQETQRGVELMAVCSKRQIRDDRAAKIATQDTEFQGFNEKSSQLSKNYLNELRSRATIIYQ